MYGCTQCALLFLWFINHNITIMSSSSEDICHYNNQETINRLLQHASVKCSWFRTTNCMRSVAPVGEQPYCCRVVLHKALNVLCPLLIYHIVSLSYLHNILTFHKTFCHGSNGFTSPPKEVTLWIFIALKNPSSLATFEPVNLWSNGKHINH
jgi:hypothetical protein